jgi:hypothetical protein
MGLIYVSYMKSACYPLAIPEDLLGDVRQTAKETGLSLADAMRQSIRLGLPKLREQLSAEGSLKAFTAEENRLAFKVPNQEFDALEFHCATLNMKVTPFEE